MNNFSSIPKAVEKLKKGGMVVVVDSPERENQGDIIFAAETVSKEKINFLMQNCRGFICTPITKSKAMQLDLPLMVSSSDNTEQTRLNMTVTVDAKTVTEFGISALDRTKTIQAIVSNKTKPNDLVRPGHMFPLLARDGGVLERPGHTEATIDLVKLAGFAPIGVLSEILNDNGEAAKGQELFDFATKHNLKIIAISDLIEHIKKNPLPKNGKSKTIIRLSEAFLPTKYGNFKIIIYKSMDDNKEHAALVMDDINKQPVLTRIHSQCFTGDTLSSLRCDCQDQLHESMKAINKNGSGIVIYLNQEGRGIGLANKIRAYELQDQGMDTLEANHALGFASDSRSYKDAAAILCDLGVTKIELLTNSPDKIQQLEDDGVDIVKTIPFNIKPNKFNKKYLSTKKEKLKHLIKYV